MNLAKMIDHTCLKAENHFTHMRIEWDERSAPPLTLSFHIHEFGREIEHSDNMEVVASSGSTILI